ncbi:MAG: PHB depolymerase family esterase [Flavobacteriales bacterium]
MRHLSTLLFALSVCAGQAQDTITVGALQRTYTVRLPSAYDGTTPLPLVIAMHGGFGSGTQLENQSQLSVKAEEKGFIVVYPDGVPSLLGIRTWNAGGCCAYAMNNNIDDVGFIDALLDTLQADFAIDAQRVYATGMSNGGFMSYRLACELSERFAAIAPVSASMTIAVCQPIRPVPVIGLHSYLDTSVPYLGGIGDGVSDHYNSPQDSVQTAFALHANCAVLRDTIQDDAELTVIRWHECDCQQEMLLYMTRDGGHSWPGGQGTGIGDPPSTTINANDLMWDFFQQYSLDCALPTDIPATRPDDHPVVFPNPASGAITVVGDHVFLALLDVCGKAVLSLDTRGRDRSVLDLTDVRTGTYTLLATDAHGLRSSARVIVQ